MRMEPTLIPSMMESHDQEFTCFFVNNNASVGVGGTHWSLLVLDNHSKMFHHFDSAGCMNEKVAEHLANSIATSFGWLCKPIQKAKCQQQSATGSDCGIHALKFCEAIIKEIGIEEAKNLRFCASEERNRILNWIQSGKLYPQ